MQAVHAELHNLWPIVKHLRSTEVYHCQANPDNEVEGAGRRSGVTIYQDGDVPVITDFKGDNSLLGLFENMDDPSDPNTYVMLQNKRHAMDTPKNHPSLVATARFRPASADLQVSRFDAQAARWEPLEMADGACSLTLDGGQGLLLRFSPAP